MPFVFPAFPGLPLALPADRAPLVVALPMKQIGHNFERMVVTVRPHLFSHLGIFAVSILPRTYSIVCRLLEIFNETGAEQKKTRYGRNVNDQEQRNKEARVLEGVTPLLLLYE